MTAAGKGDKVSPWPAPTNDTEFAEFIAKLKAGMHYSTLLTRVPGIPATDEQYFRDILLDVKEDWEASAPPSNGNGKGKGRKPPEKRGPKRKRDAKADQRIFDAWKNGNGEYTDLYELAPAFNLSHAEVKKAIGRVRYHKRKKKKKKKSAE